MVILSDLSLDAGSIPARSTNLAGSLLGSQIRELGVAERCRNSGLSLFDVT